MHEEAFTILQAKKMILELQEEKKIHKKKKKKVQL
jgi:hypothetical protein